MITDLRHVVRSIGVPRLIIFAFIASLLVLAAVTGLQVKDLISDSLVRIGMNGILVLSLVPTIQGGLGMNFGLPLGVICGLLGSLTAVEFNLRGWTGFLAAILFSVPLAIIAGLVYAWLLEQVKGQEMMVGTYVGFSAVAGMCIAWLLLPYKNPIMIWAVGGKGLRTTISLGDHFAKLLNNFLKLNIGGITVPTGLLLFFLLFCALWHLFSRTRTGMALNTAGSNELYAISSGIDVQHMRRLAVVISTVLAAIGIVVYAQAYGFIQLYTAPLMMAFPAIAAVLLGGASVQKASVSNVILGAILFQTMLTIALPVTSSVIEGDISEVARVVISNGMILYALTRPTGGN
jgi:simple sugar transport system permease protein